MLNEGLKKLQQTGFIGNLSASIDSVFFRFIVTEKTSTSPTGVWKALFGKRPGMAFTASSKFRDRFCKAVRLTKSDWRSSHSGTSWPKKLLWCYGDCIIPFSFIFCRVLLSICDLCLCPWLLCTTCLFLHSYFLNFLLLIFVHTKLCKWW